MKKQYSLLSLARYCALSAVILFGSLPLSASAMDIPFFQNNDIFYYDPGAGSACTAVGTNYSTPTDIPGLSGADDEEKAWNYFTSTEVGLSPEQAAGVMGVGYGLEQWTGSRLAALEAAAEEEGITLPNLGFQLASMVQESKDRQVKIGVTNLVNDGAFGEPGDNEWETLKKQVTVVGANLFWNASKQPSTGSGETAGLDKAEEIYEKYKDKEPAEDSQPSTSSNNASCTAAGSGDLIATLLEYAHPQYHPNNYDTPVPPPKPAYLEVATKIEGEGRFVGGGTAEIGIPGIDCGGFVSILLTQSGFEPDYNYGLDWDRGASNQNGAGDSSGGQLGWAQRHWKYLGNGGQINTSDLRPGDVAFSNGHTFLFVGQVTGFESQYVSP